MNWFDKNPAKAKLILLLTLAAAFMLLLIIAELTFGYFTYKHKYSEAVNSGKRYIRLRENPPNTDITEEITADAKKRNEIVNLPQKSYRLKTDDDGFIFPGKIYKKPDITLFFLGGSTTECRAVSEDKRFPYLAGRLLEKAGGLKVNSYNGGVSGNHSMHSINILINKVLPHHPDIVVLMHNANDILLIPYGSYWNNKPGKSLVMKPNENEKKEDSKNLLNLPVLREWAVKSLHSFVWSPAPDNYTKYLKNDGEKIVIDKKQVLMQFESSLKTFSGVCKAWNIKPVLMTQPIFEANSKTYSGEFPDKFEFTMPVVPLKDSVMLYVLYSFHELFNGIIRKVAEEENILLIDLKKQVPAQDHKFIYDLYHYNDEGSELIAKIISGQLLQYM